MTLRKKIKKITPKWLLWLYWRAKNTKIKVLSWIPKYAEDGLMTAHLCEFMVDLKFKQAYEAAVSGGHAIWSDKIHWRAHVVCWAGVLAKKLEGDFVECGVARGFLSRVLMEYINFKEMKDRKFYLIDTYEGIPEKYLTVKEKEKGMPKYPLMYEFVCEAFKQYKNTQIVKGKIPDILDTVTTDKVAYLSIDLNCTIPEIAAAEYFWGKLVKGGVVVLDDYGHSGHEEQHKAFDEFAKRKNVPILECPTGQGIIIKI